MTKKDYVLRLLTALHNSWNLAPGLQILVESSSDDAQFIDDLVVAIKHSVDSVLDVDQKDKLQKSLGFLQKLQAMELDQHSRDEKDIQDLENIISSI